MTTPSSTDNASPNNLAALRDVRQLGFLAAIGSLSYVFWVVGAMEMIERLAFYGVHTVKGLYATAAVKDGGLGITMTDFGTITGTWAFVQSALPIVTGGLSDRFGYKQTIFLSTVLKIGGYLLMAAFPSFWGFFAGVIVLAAGTAIFKPGIQGTLVKASKRENSSMAWGIFYQTVNIGGFIGPLLAGYMRKLAWHNVFLACAAVISVNFLLLLTYKEPGKAEREAELAKAKAAGTQRNLVRESLQELAKPHVWLYLLIFSGFWFMFMSLFDVLTLHLNDWVDTRDVVSTLREAPGAVLGSLKAVGYAGAGVVAAVAGSVNQAMGDGPVTASDVVRFFVVLDKSGTQIQPEGMLNINSGLIMTTCFLFAYASGKMSPINSMIVGTLLASGSLLLSGASTLGWASVAAISVFSVGEMLSSPKFSEYIGNFAPEDKKGMYLGFSQMSLAIGWTLEGKLGPWLYGVYGSKDTFAREYLAANGMAADAVTAIPGGEAFQRLCAHLHQPDLAVTKMLYAAHNPAIVWNIMAVVGLVTSAGIWWYGTWVSKRSRQA